MIKKIILTLLLGYILFACGKKGDPIYNEENSKIFSAQQSSLT